LVAASRVEFLHTITETTAILEVGTSFANNFTSLITELSNIEFSAVSFITSFDRRPTLGLDLTAAFNPSRLTSVTTKDVVFLVEDFFTTIDDETSFDVRGSLTDVKTTFVVLASDVEGSSIFFTTTLNGIRGYLTTLGLNPTESLVRTSESGRHYVYTNLFKILFFYNIFFLLVLYQGNKTLFIPL
jgi:hypothetical protein